MADNAKEYDKLTKDLKLKAAGFEAKFESLIKDWKTIEALNLQIYQLMPRPDSLLNESPYSSLRMLMNFRNNLAKLGWHWAGRNVHGLEHVKRFTVVVNEAIIWGERLFKDEDARIFALKEEARLAALKDKRDISAIV